MKKIIFLILLITTFIFTTGCNNNKLECSLTNDKFTLVDLNNNFDKIDGYGAVYKIGKYLFENYDKEFILELTHNNEKLKMIISDVIPNLNTIKKH